MNTEKSCGLSANYANLRELMCSELSDLLPFLIRANS